MQGSPVEHWSLQRDISFNAAYIYFADLKVLREFQNICKPSDIIADMELKQKGLYLIFLAFSDDNDSIHVHCRKETED